MAVDHRGKPLVLTVDGDGYPLPARVPGDEARVAEVIRQVTALTDVGSVATVLRAAVAQAVKVRVRMEVLQDATRAAWEDRSV